MKKREVEARRVLRMPEAGAFPALVSLLLLLILLPQVFSISFDDIRSAGERYSKGEAIMVDGPFYVGGKPYYVLDYMFLAENRGSLVYDPAKGEFVKDREIIRKVLATKDLKLLTISDPLFYAVGNASLIPLASEFEVQNVRNFAAYATLDDVEREKLEKVLESYAKLMQDVAEISEITSSMLYPNNSLSFEYAVEEPHLRVKVVRSSIEGNYSYEGFSRLIAAYNKLLDDYYAYGVNLVDLAGQLEEYPPGATIREKWEIVIKKEDILREVELVNENAKELEKEIKLRESILNSDYSDAIAKAYARMGAKPVCGPTAVLLIPALFLLRRRAVHLFLAALLLLSPAYAVHIPTPEELISQKISLEEVKDVKIKIEGKNITEEEAREILYGFPLLLRGEGVVVKGPYLADSHEVYLFDIVDAEGKPTGFVFLVDKTTGRLVGSQRQAFQLMKAGFLRELVEREPIYLNFDESEVVRIAEGSPPPLNYFLQNLSESIERGKALEEELLSNLSFEVAVELAKEYTRSFMLLYNIRALTSEERASEVTAGFYDRLLTLEAYARVSRGMTAEEFFEARKSQYRGRSINRIPLIARLSAFGLRPSKAQVIHDLTSDLIYDNVYLWRLGRYENTNLFARLSYKEGTQTTPSSVRSEGGG